MNQKSINRKLSITENSSLFADKKAPRRIKFKFFDTRNK